MSKWGMQVKYLVGFGKLKFTTRAVYEIVSVFELTLLTERTPNLLCACLWIWRMKWESILIFIV